MMELQNLYLNLRAIYLNREKKRGERGEREWNMYWQVVSRTCSGVCPGHRQNIQPLNQSELHHFFKPSDWLMAESWEVSWEIYDKEGFE